MHCKRPPFTPCQVGDGPIERLAHRVWRVRGDTDPNMRRGQGAESRESLLQLLHARSALCRIGTEHLLEVDPARAEAREGLERRAGAPAAGEARAGRGPRLAAAPA